MASPNVWMGQEATVKIGDVVTDVTTDSNLEDQLDNDSPTDYTGIITEITITDPEASAEIVNTFDGQIKAESPHDLVTVDFTMRFQDLDIFQEFHGEASTITSGSSWVRISGGHQIGCRPSKGILFKLSRDCNGTVYTVHYFLNDAWFTQLGEVSLAGDGNAELTGTAVCLVEDRYIEQNF